MSKFEYERGEIDFSKTGFAQFVRLFRKEINTHLDSLFQSALTVHAELSKIKGRGAFSKQKDAFESYFRHVSEYSGYGAFRMETSSTYSLVTVKGSVPVDDEHKRWVRDELFRSGERLTKPRKSTLPLLNNKQYDFQVHCNEATLTLVPSVLSLKWNVPENNHAIRDAHNSVSYKLFLNAIDKYKWKRGEGGVYYSLNEFDRERAYDCSEALSENVSGRFGPEGEREYFLSLGHPQKSADAKVKDFMDKQKRKRF
jgi:hypothetical protein